MAKTRKVNQAIIECIDDAFTKLGKSVKESIYYYLKRDFGLDRNQITKNPEIFEKALNRIFGERGAQIIEKMIIIEIRNRFQLEKQSTLTFRELITCLQKDV